MIKNIITAAISALVVSFAVIWLVGGNHSATTSTLGAANRDTNFNNLGALTLGIGTGCNDAYSTCAGFAVDATGAVDSNSTIIAGGILSTTTPTSLSLQASDIGYSTISMTPSVGAITVTLPASTTLSSFLPNAGDTTRVNIINATTTAAAAITLAGSSGSLLQSASTTVKVLPGGQDEIFATRKANSDIIFTLVPAI